MSSEADKQKVPREAARCPVCDTPGHVVGNVTKWFESEHQAIVSEIAKERDEEKRLHAVYEDTAEKFGEKIFELERKLEVAIQLLKFYSQGGNSQTDIWYNEHLGYFTGKRAKEFLESLSDKT